jgi:fructokinase
MAGRGWEISCRAAKVRRLREWPAVIVVVGEALIDLAVAPDGAIRAHPGGGPFNVARTLGRLGTPVTFIGRVSRDGFGQRLRAALLRDGVTNGGIVDTDDPTTLAVAELDVDGAARYRFYLEGTSAPGLQPEDALERLPDGVTALHVGTLALAVAPAVDAVLAVAERLAGRALVMVDPNCRPGIGGTKARLDAILPFTDVVKVSEEDLALLGATPASLLASGPRVVLVTRGAAGATIVTSTATTDVPAPRIQVADTIGAGDAFGAAFLASWQDAGGTPAALETAGRFAVAVAARTCERPGAEPPWRSELSS